MEVAQALQIIDQALATIQTNRQGHEQLRAALNVVTNALMSGAKQVSDLEKKVEELEGSDEAEGSKDEEA